MEKSGSFNSKLSRRVLIYILLCSSLLSISSTFLQLYVNYNESLSTLDQRFNNVETSYLQSISTSLWDFNEPLVKQQIQGIVKLPDISHVKIVTGFGKVYQFGDEKFSADKVVEFPRKKYEKKST